MVDFSKALFRSNILLHKLEQMNVHPVLIKGIGKLSFRQKTEDES